MKAAMATFVGGIAAVGLGVAAAADDDHDAGRPLSPSEAAGGWTVESGGHDICMIRLTATHIARPDARCEAALPDGVAAWAATADGMALTTADGKVLVPFSRWSNSLFVSRRSSGTDVQLKRGPPNSGA